MAIPAALAVAVVWLVPEANDYALATRAKHERLAGGDPNRGKVVFVGGSNLAYGLDSGAVEAATGRHAVNMGMNGYFGVRFMLEEVKPDLRAGDVVVVAFEYDSYYSPVEGVASDLLMAVKARPENVAFLSGRQRIDVLKAVPYVAQQKLVRLVRESGRWVRARVRGYSTEDPLEMLNLIESFAGFEEHGDLVSHRGVRWDGAPNPGFDLSRLDSNAEVIAAMRAFSEAMEARGVAVLISYTPVARSFFDAHRKSIRALHERLQATASLSVPSPPEDFVMPDDWFFDTVYHLEEDRRRERARRVIEDIELTLRADGTPGVAAAQSVGVP